MAEHQVSVSMKPCKHCNGTGVVKQTRKVTPYNLFFTEHMKSPAIKALPHQQRMKAIAAKWAQHKKVELGKAASQAK